jgi:recombination protein RecA
MIEKNIKDIINRINKASNKEVAFGGNDSLKVEGSSTGIEVLDYAMGCNGYPKGRITEIYGLPGAAKTSLTLWGIATAQKEGKVCMFIDAEFALDIEHAKKLGVDTDNLIIIRPDSGEEAFEVIEKMLIEGDVDFIVVDSIPSLIPVPELEAEINKPTMGGQARLIASALRRIVPLVAKQNAVLILINQMRVNIMGGQYDPYTTPGGMSLKFYTSIRIQISMLEKLKVSGEIVGQRIKFKMRKNKVGMNNDEGVIDLDYKTGFKSKLDLVDVGIKIGVITRSGNTYSIKDIKLGVGKEKALEALESNPELQLLVRQEYQQ